MANRAATSTTPEWVSTNRDLLAKAYYHAHEAIRGNNAYGFEKWDDLRPEGREFFYAYADAMIDSIKRGGERLVDL